MVSRDTVLMAVLDCGTMDLCVLDDVEYDLGAIVDELFAEGLRPSLNLIMQEVFRKAAEEMTGHVEEMIEDTRRQSEEAMEDGDHAVVSLCAEKLSILHRLHPSEDIECYCNCLDTSVYFAQNEKLYREYLSEAVEVIERHTGFSF